MPKVDVIIPAYNAAKYLPTAIESVVAQTFEDFWTSYGQYVTGWTNAAGMCDSCLRSAKMHSAFSDPHGGWVAPHPHGTES